MIELLGKLCIFHYFHNTHLKTNLIFFYFYCILPYSPMYCTYLHRCSGLAGVIDTNFPIFTHCGQELAIWAPSHAKDLNITHKRKQEKKEESSETKMDSCILHLQIYFSMCKRTYLNIQTVVQTVYIYDVFI